MTPLIPLGSLAALTVLIVATYALRDWLKARRNRPDDAPQDALDRSKDALGLTGLPDLLFLVVAFFWLILTLTLAINLLAMIWTIPGLTLFEDAPDPQIIRATLLTIAALTTTAGAAVALPITLRRAALQRRQTDTAELALFNEKINAATNDLHSMRQITRDGETIHEPDIVRRNAAIDALFGLAQERPEETGRIARMLSVYVRELSDTEAKAETPPENAAPDALREWAQNLKLQRSDMQAAVQILGRLHTDIRNPNLKPDDIDLSKANLQAMDLPHLCFDKAKLIGAQMQGAELWEAQMQGANLGWAQMQGAELGWAQMQGAYLGHAQMQGASLGWAQMQGAYLGHAKMQGAYLVRAQMQGASLGWAEFDAYTDFKAAVVQFAALKSDSLRDANLTQEQINSSFGDAATPLPDGLTRPDHWDRDYENYNAFHTAWRKWRAAQPGWDPDWE